MSNPVAIVGRVQGSLVACHLAGDDGSEIFVWDRLWLSEALGRKLKRGEIVVFNVEFSSYGQGPNLRLRGQERLIVGIDVCGDTILVCCRRGFCRATGIKFSSRHLRLVVANFMECKKDA